MLMWEDPPTVGGGTFPLKEILDYFRVEKAS